MSADHPAPEPLLGMEAASGDAQVEPGSPTPPERSGGPSLSDSNWPHRRLYDRVRQALYAVPAQFETELNITGVKVPDLPSLNIALGASIEGAVVDTLNRTRGIWDPDGQYQAYAWMRFPQGFPDVRLMTDEPGAVPILMGIELKGYFVMSKELEPSFRFTTTEACCAEADLLVMYPWYLSQVVSGTPRLLKPWIEEARYAARMRNHYWAYGRPANPAPTVRRRGGRTRAEANTAITVPTGVSSYPGSKKRINDKPAEDDGGNFGRLARSGMMDDYVAELGDTMLSGIPLRGWVAFLKATSGEGRLTHGQMQNFARRLAVSLDVSGVPAVRAAVERALEELEDDDTSGNSQASEAPVGSETG